MSESAERYLSVVRQHIDSMLEVGRQVADAPPCPLFAGVVDAGARIAITAMTPLPPGIRQADFNWAGNNLMHDLPMLEVMNHLSSQSGEDRYTRAVNEMLAFYAKHCPEPDTGLFPWGEHGQWSLADGSSIPCSFTHGLKHFRVDNFGVHDHLHFAPPWFWQQLGKHGPDVVLRFARGLNGHIVNPQTMEHNRHAAMTANWWRDPNAPPDSEPGKDFARHAGFYILDCAQAALLNPSDGSDVLDWAQRKLAYHMGHRLADGQIRGCIRTAEFDQPSAQHDSLALSVWDAGQSLGMDSTAGRVFNFAAEELFAASRNRLEREGLPALPKLPHIKDGEAWMCGYFRKPKTAFPNANIHELLHARLKQPHLVELAVRDAKWVREEVGLPPEHLPVMARAHHLAIDTCIAAYTLAGDEGALKHACTLADRSVAMLFHNGLLLGYSGLRFIWKRANGEIYHDPFVTPNTPGFTYSISGTPGLVRTLYRLGRLLEGQDIGPNPYLR